MAGGGGEGEGHAVQCPSHVDTEEKKEQLLRERMLTF